MIARAIIRNCVLMFIVGAIGATIFAATFDDANANQGNNDRVYVTRGEWQRLAGQHAFVIRRHTRAINDLTRLVIRVCAIRQYEDMSGMWERNDDTRNMCAEFVSQIGR